MVLASEIRLVVLCALLLFGLSRPVAAQPRYQLSLGVTAGATDNSLGVSPDGDARGDAFLTARAGALLLMAGQLSTHTLGYTLAATTYARDTQGTSLSNGLSWLSTVTPSAATQLTVGANATHSRLSTVDTLGVGGGATAAPISGARPGGAVFYVAASALEAFSWHPTPNWHISQGFSVRGFQPLDDASTQPGSFGYDNTLGIGRMWTRDELGLSLRAGRTYALEVTVNDQVVSKSRNSDLAEALLSWQHEYSASWTSELAAGALAVHIPDQQLTIVEPAVNGTLNYVRPGFGSSLHAAHTVTPNIFIGDTVLRDDVALSGFSVLDRQEQLRLRAMLGYEHDRAAQASGSSTGVADVFHARVGLAYTTNGPAVYSLDYTFIDQEGGTREPGMPVPFQTFRRSVIMATVEWRYPFQDPAVQGRAQGDGAAAPGGR